MTPWQRRLRAAIAVFGVAFAGLVYYGVRRPAPPPAPAAVGPRVDPSAATEVSSGVYLSLRGTREDFRVEYDKSLAWTDGRTRFLGARIFVGQREGRDFKIAGRQADVSANQEQVAIEGDVEMTVSDGLVVRTPAAAYNKSDGVVRAGGVVEFQRRHLSGRAIGMTYDQPRDVLWLLDRAEIALARDNPGDAPLEIAAGAAGFARRDHYVRFDRGFRLVDAGRVLTCDTAMAYLSDDDARIEILEMRGHSSVTGIGSTPGALSAMAAQDINIEFAEDGHTLTRATLSQGASIDVAGAASQGRKVSGGWIDLQLAADGTTVTSFVARGGTRLDLPKEGDQPARTITAGTLTAAGDPGKGFTTASFMEGVTFREERPPAAGGAASPPRIAQARKLDLAVQPGFGAIDDARFSGAARFEEGAIRAAAGDARYQVGPGVLLLEGIDDTTNLMPRVADDHVTIEGQQIQVTLEGQAIVAKLDVRTVMHPVRDTPGAPGAAVGRPSMLKADQAVSAAAASLTYDGKARLAVYEGAVRLWQGDTAIQGDRLTVDDTTGNLAASGNVRSTLALDQASGSAKAPVTPGTPGADRPAKAGMTIARAAEMAYEERTRRATYTTGAHVAGPQGDLRADKIELHLTTSGNELDRLEAYGTVILRADARDATGDRLTYFAPAERYVLAGSPVRFTADCRETTGRTLTFFKSTDRITVDGNEETRTQTKGGATCGAPRLH